MNSHFVLREGPLRPSSVERRQRHELCLLRAAPWCIVTLGLSRENRLPMPFVTNIEHGILLDLAWMKCGARDVQA
jgi:hypothetical protein